MPKLEIIMNAKYKDTRNGNIYRLSMYDIARPIVRIIRKGYYYDIRKDIFEKYFIKEV